ncbi:hypothetical protein Rs2_15269 [Raphanus sativus]|nr:hypothetical protein Rs2_15269 [Raphanus sativus]
MTYRCRFRRPTITSKNHDSRLHNLIRPDKRDRFTTQTTFGEGCNAIINVQFLLDRSSAKPPQRRGFAHRNAPDSLTEEQRNGKQTLRPPPLEDNLLNQVLTPSRETLDPYLSEDKGEPTSTLAEAHSCVGLGTYGFHIRPCFVSNDVELVPPVREGIPHRR